MISIIVVAVYFALILCVGIITRVKWNATPESYFLANRGLGTFVLLGTLAATNFSAFTVFGVSGAGYRGGYAFFPIMGFGTGFMAITFTIIGKKVLEKSRSLGAITPSELAGKLYDNNPGVRLLIAGIMILYTIPYLALQPMAAGYALEELLGLPYKAGCGITTAVILLYTLRGGLKAIAWTDVIQGIFMFLMLALSLILLSSYFGGFIEANRTAYSQLPEFFSRPGGLRGGAGKGAYLPGIWFSYIFLWFFADPMFPQLFQRFNAAKGYRALSKTMLFYPLICTAVFFIPVSLGVMGRLLYPELGAQQADSILPLVLSRISGPLVASLVTTAGLAALMSTMDSQLLTLSSITTRDIVQPIAKKLKFKGVPGTLTGRVATVVLAAAGFLAAINPPATLLEIATHSFTGLAALFPAVLFGLYLKRPPAAAAIASLVTGQGVLVFFLFSRISSAPFLPVVWVVLFAFAAYILTLFVLKRSTLRVTSLIPYLREAKAVKSPYTWGFILLFLLALDFWNWGKEPILFLGLPLWIFYFILLSGVQTLLMFMWIRKTEDIHSGAPQGRP